MAKHLIGKAVKEIFAKYFPDAYKAKEKGEGRFRLRSDLPLVRPGQEGRDLRRAVDARDQRLAQVNGLEDLPKRYLPMRDPAELPTGMEFVLEALHELDPGQGAHRHGGARLHRHVLDDARGRRRRTTDARPSVEAGGEVVISATRWDERMVQNLAFLENLLSLYHRLLLMTDGNVDEALRALEEWVSASASSTRSSRSRTSKKWLKDEDAIQEVDGRPS